MKHVMSRKDTIRAKSITDPVTGCWVWRGHKDKQGYGSLCYNRLRTQAHIASYHEYVGPVPTGLCVLHKCDNPSCVNPAHLFIGTYKDNMQDAVEKKRMATGSKNGNAKLTEEKIKQIFALKKQGVSNGKISKLIGCANQTVSAVLLRQIWSHVEI